MLNILAQYPDLSKVSDSLMTHREIEVLKTAFVLRMNLEDPDFVDIKNVLNDMLSQTFAADLIIILVTHHSFQTWRRKKYYFRPVACTICKINYVLFTGL